jgi:hypothetical protein
LSKAQEILLHVGLDYLWIEHIKHNFNNSKAIACGSGTTDSLHLYLLRHLLVTLNWLGQFMRPPKYQSTRCDLKYDRGLT